MSYHDNHVTQKKYSWLIGCLIDWVVTCKWNLNRHNVNPKINIWHIPHLVYKVIALTDYVPSWLGPAPLKLKPLNVKGPPIKNRSEIVNLEPGLRGSMIPPAAQNCKTWKTATYRTTRVKIKRRMIKLRQILVITSF